MFKSMLVALALVSAAPVMAQDTVASTNGFDEAAVDAGLRIDFGPGGIGLDFYPGRRPRWNRPGRPPMITCVAENARGARYHGRAWDDNRAAREAMQQCRWDSRFPRSCRIIACRYTR